MPDDLRIFFDSHCSSAITMEVHGSIIYRSVPSKKLTCSSARNH